MHHIFIIIAAVLWGMDGLLRSKLYTVSPLVIVFWEHLIGLVLLSILLLLRKHSFKLSSFTQKLIFSAIFVSLFSGLIGTLAFTSALARVNYIPFSIVFLIQKLQPIFTIGTAYIFLNEKPSSRFLLWSAIAICAGFFMTFPGGHVTIDQRSPYAFAAALALIAAVSWGVSTVFSRYMLQRLPMLTVTFVRFALTTLIAGVAMYVSGAHRIVLTLLPDQYVSLGLIACSTGMVALLIYYKGLQHIPAHVSCILELAFPITGLVIDATRGAFLSPSQYIASLFMVFAIYKVIRNQRANRHAPSLVTNTHHTSG